MIKLLRDIRKQLLSKGKTAKYLKYVIGEMLFMLIGVLPPSLPAGEELAQSQ